MVGCWLDMGSADILYAMYLGKSWLKLGKIHAPANHFLPPSSHGRHGAPPPASRHTTISRHATKQVYVVKTRIGDTRVDWWLVVAYAPAYKSSFMIA